MGARCYSCTWVDGPLLPVYLKHYYKNEGIFADTKIVTSVYGLGYEGELEAGMKAKMAFDAIDENVLGGLEAPTFENLMKLTIDHSDALIIGSEDLNSNLTKYIESSKKPFLPFTPKDSLREAYTAFIEEQVL